MKRTSVAALVAVVGLALLGGLAYAGPGQGQGCGPCGYGQGQSSGKAVDVNALRAFQKETLPLRDEMMAKRVEIRNEQLKEKPDLNRIAALQKEMIDLRTKIQAAAGKHGLPAAGFGPGMAGRGPGHGPGMMGGRGCGGQGYEDGQGRGYGNGPCGRM